MGAEIGATCSIFPYDKRMETYLNSTNRKDIASLENHHTILIKDDPEDEQHHEIFIYKII